MEARVYSNQELSSACYMVLFKYWGTQSLLGNERTGMNEWMGKHVWRSCVEIEGYSVTSSKCRIAELSFVIFLSSGLSSAFTGRLLFHCEVAYVSLAV